MSKKTTVINLLRDITLQVDIRSAGGDLSSVQIVGRGRVELEDGASVDARYLSLHAKEVRVVPPSEENPAPDASVVITGDA